MMPYKRPAADKSGMPVYQPSATTYQQLMQLQQQPFVPVSCEYTSPPPVVTSAAAEMPNVTVSSQLALPPPASSSPAQQVAVTTVVTSAADSVVQHALAETNGLSVETPKPVPPPGALDAAALAKEVAQQNYAKAVKLAQVSQSYGGLGSVSLSALNYTGMALNKQPTTVLPQAIPTALPPRYSHLPFAFTGAAGPTMGIAGLPYGAQAGQPNLLAFSRPPPTAINPYSLMRPATQTFLSPQGHMLAAAAAAAGNPYGLTAPQVALPQTPVSMSITTTNNNNVVLQPYKKMKTT